MDRRLAEIAERQCGVLTRNQVRECGHSDRWLSHQLAARRWQHVGRGVYLNTTGGMTVSQRHWAAVLRCGPGAALAGESAIGLWIPGRTEPTRHVVAIDERRRVQAEPGLDTWLVQDLDRLVHPARDPRRLRLEPAVLMTAARCRVADDAIGIVADACGSLRTTPARLHEMLHALPDNVRHRRLLAALLDDVAAGAYSYLEVQFLRTVERPHGLPTGRRQRRVTIGSRPFYRDVEYIGYDVVAELDGRLGHELYADRADDMDRDNVTVVGGAVTTRLGYRHVFRSACASALLVGGLLRARGWSGDLRRCGRQFRIG